MRPLNRLISAFLGAWADAALRADNRSLRVSVAELRSEVHVARQEQELLSLAIHRIRTEYDADISANAKRIAVGSPDGGISRAR